jgi:hypothetical protein
MAVPILFYGTEVRVSKRDESRLKSAEMKNLKSVKRCIRSDRIKNEHVTEEPNIFTIRKN